MVVSADMDAVRSRTQALVRRAVADLLDTHQEGFLVRSYLPERIVFAEDCAARGAAML